MWPLQIDLAGICEFETNFTTGKFLLNAIFIKDNICYALLKVHIPLKNFGIEIFTP